MKEIHRDLLMEGLAQSRTRPFAKHQWRTESTPASESNDNIKRAFYEVFSDARTQHLSDGAIAQELREKMGRGVHD